MNSFSSSNTKICTTKTWVTATILLILSACQSRPPSPSTQPNLSGKQALICDHAHRWQGQVVGNGHCVALIKKCSESPPTDQWRPGSLVKNNALLPGTIIATFVNQHYPSKRGYHAAIYIEQTPEGIWVWDQWRGKAVHRRLIRWQNPGALHANRGSAYRVVTIAKGE